MIPCLIKKCMNNRGFNLVELMMAISFSVFLMAGVVAFYNAANQAYSSGITAQSLQDGANIVINKIIEGATESGVVYRLSTATAYYIPNVNSSMLYYCQSSPCTAANTPARYYTLDVTNTKVLSFIIRQPTRWDMTSSIRHPRGLRFSTPRPTVGRSASPRPQWAHPANVVEIDVALTENLAANITNKKYATSGSASTFVLLRNHP